MNQRNSRLKDHQIMGIVGILFMIFISFYLITEFLNKEENQAREAENLAYHQSRRNTEIELFEQLQTFQGYQYEIIEYPTLHKSWQQRVLYGIYVDVTVQDQTDKILYENLMNELIGDEWDIQSIDDQYFEIVVYNNKANRTVQIERYADDEWRIKIYDEDDFESNIWNLKEPGNH